MFSHGADAVHVFVGNSCRCLDEMWRIWWMRRQRRASPERCGQPLSRIVNEPALRNNGVPKLNAARTEFWVYGPSGGVYRHLRFIDGKLVEIRLDAEVILRLLRSYSYMIITNSLRNTVKER